MHNTLIDADSLHAQMQRPSAADDRWVIIDCRFSLADTDKGACDYQLSHIPGAHYAHLDEHLSGPIINGRSGRHPLPERDSLSKQFRAWQIDSATQIVAYDDASGAIASRLWWLSRWLGHQHCAVLDGGYAAWRAAGLPVNAELPDSRCEGAFVASAALVDVVEKSDVLDAGNCLLDARESYRYSGEREPIDPVAGHIPGALNEPFQNNVDSNGRFNSAASIRQRFTTIETTAGARRLVHYCGSGVTAAHNMLAMAYAGMDPGALYAGSFSEWVNSDDARFPVARLVD